MAPNTVAATPLEEERPPFPLGIATWCTFLWWMTVTEAGDSAAAEQLPVDRRKKTLVYVRIRHKSVIFDEGSLRFS